jgi:type I restriction enzyme S subunit
MTSWPTKKLGEICEERKEKNINNENLPVFTVSHIYGLIPYQNIFYKQVHSKDTKNYKIVNRYDFAFGLPTKDTLPYGLLENEDKVLVSPAYVVFSIKNKNLLSPRFLYYLLKTNYYKWKIIEMAKSQSATRHGLPLKFHHLANFEIPLPPLPIQQKIVEILDTIQSAVEIQEKIIEKTKELKKSLMNLLFHYGLAGLRVKELVSSRIGELTSSEIEKLGLKLKKTEVGEIPEDWEVVMLGEVVNPKDGIKRGPWGGSIKKEIFVPSGYKVYEQGNVLNNDFERGEYFISETKFLELKSFEVRSGDILVTAAGSLGAIAVVPENIKPGIINQALIRIRLDETKMVKKFFKYLFDKIIATGMIERYSHGATLKNFASVSILKNFKIPLPPLPEQQEIAEILQTIDQKIEIEKKKKELYGELFKTMLNKIMTAPREILKNYLTGETAP